MHIMLKPRQAEKTTGLSKDITELNEPTAFTDDVEQIAVFTGGRVGPLARGALPRARPAQANKHGSPGCIPNVSDDPVVPDTPTVEEIMPADQFGLFGKPPGEIGCLI